MTSNTALVVEVPERGAAVRAERHLRVLPPPAAYAVTPARAAGRRGPGLAAAVPAPRLRLTARGRRLVAVLALAVGVGVVALGDALLGDGEDGLELMGTSSVVVERGDTLWAIASSVAGDEDVRVVIDEIVELNALDGGAIEPGQVLLLP
ncbi:hypothetical protein DQ244_16725 [Blastococcus sp. TBT05-19]|uniref:LysM peptidoglycan-binding domain-containing protein n=1 Tax=Blastococcus sp. TBT05-19 TaxID=2250581 RepID=UPI000DE87FCA|nr:LysM peptidoglycan-binding domain-containing protein [Blastococcus sp. TBT05-19]RBY88184.1 hypothetical protein DQ244_16725 [Blastococcus sp. TBT05-19]